MSSEVSVPPPMASVTKKDLFGCSSNKLGKDQELRCEGIGFFRKGSDDPRLGQVATEADDRGYLIGMSLANSHRRRIFHATHATSHDFDEGSVYLRDLAVPYRADLAGSFDFLLMEISRPFLIAFAEEHGLPAGAEFMCVTGTKDPVLSNLLQATLPTFQESASNDLLFLDQLGLTIGAHLFERYAAASMTPIRQVRSPLSKAQLAIATEMLSQGLGDKVTLSDVAAACGLSRGYFIHAFRKTTGLPPHRWVLSHRIERARELILSSDLSLAQIAAVCGFADQSHFTRVFSRSVGTSPGNWRRLTKI
ncbi:AraC family transcriptional regulator [Tardiphaga alba]|uniref:AraC family transcriptional regulator n=1 Tax=Tardiphaga alba TaxID=340268 RepID=A0ABX8A3D7_9BRAD|nr:AraC family transcriptional regulator [Tardiphaga alba]QUS38068.1 AraC family transcriptional regulator [Tardiphaga alba]